MMTLGINFRDEADNIVERVDITGDLLVQGRHLRNSIMCCKSLMLLGVLSLLPAHKGYPLIFQTKVADMRLGSIQWRKERDFESVRCAECWIREGMDAGRFCRAGVLMVLASPLLGREGAEENAGIGREEMTCEAINIRIGGGGAPRVNIYSCLYR